MKEIFSIIALAETNSQIRRKNQTLPNQLLSLSLRHSLTDSPVVGRIRADTKLKKV
jgi:hypothetical protein